MIKKIVLTRIGRRHGALCHRTNREDSSAPAKHSYNQNNNRVITRSAFGMFWRSGSWNENDAIAGCDGALASPAPNPTAPEIANSLIQVAPVLAAKPSNFTTVFASDQTFNFNKAELNNAAEHQIEVLQRLIECKDVESITITGHTDNLGSIRSNQILAENRGKAVADYLQAKGMSLAQVRAKH